MEARPGWTPSSLTLVEGDEFEAALPGVTLDFARTGNGEGTHVRNLLEPSVSLHRIDIGFPMNGLGHVHGGTVALALPLRRSSATILWDGSELQLDELTLFGPGADHICTYAPGWEVVAVCAKWEAVQRAAASLRVKITEPSGKRIRRGGQAMQQFRSILADRPGTLDTGPGPDELIRGFVGLLAEPIGPASRPRRRDSSTKIVVAAIDYLEATGRWSASAIELCGATAVSERRLRAAFVDCFDVPPSVFLRRRALARASAELRRRPPEEATITDIALAHGFRHMPSFARYHREAFGELPSEVRPRSTR